MWIIKLNDNSRRYVFVVLIETMDDWFASTRENATRFESKKAAQEFKDKYSITGSIIPG